MPVRAADLETKLFVNDRDYRRGLRDAENFTAQFARNVSSKLGNVGGAFKMGGAGGMGGAMGGKSARLIFDRFRLSAGQAKRL
jgi:hypothetical protein